MLILNANLIEKIGLLTGLQADKLDPDILKTNVSIGTTEFWLSTTAPNVPVAYTYNKGYFTIRDVTDSYPVRPCIKVKDVDLSKLQIGSKAFFLGNYVYIGDSYFFNEDFIGTSQYNSSLEACYYSDSTIKTFIENWLHDTLKNFPFLVLVDDVVKYTGDKSGVIKMVDFFLKEKNKHGDIKEIKLHNVISGQEVVFI